MNQPVGSEWPGWICAHTSGRKRENESLAGLSVPGLKAAMDMLGLAGGFPRAPLSPSSSADKEKIKAVIRKTGLFPEIERGRNCEFRIANFELQVR